MRIFPSLLLLSLLSFAGCNETVADEEATLDGRWELSQAMRNNMETKMLEGLYYEFSPTGELRTNLMGNEKAGTYNQVETTITTEGVIPPLTYEVSELTDSTLKIRTELQGYRFDFELVREVEEVGTL